VCYAVFLASDRSLPLVAWDPARRALHVARVERHEAVASRAFSPGHPYLYYVGSDLHCGCGFFEHEDEAHVAAQYHDLWRYIVESVPAGASLELFSAWESDLARGLVSVRAVRAVEAEDMTAPGFRLGEQELVRVVRRPEVRS
jgi:hypothetical protein